MASAKPVNCDTGISKSPEIVVDDAGLVIFICRGKERAKIVCKNSPQSLARFKAKVYIYICCF